MSRKKIVVLTIYPIVCKIYLFMYEIPNTIYEKYTYEEISHIFFSIFLYCMFESIIITK